MVKYKIGFIGTGGRSVCYAKTYTSECDNIEIVALADPNAQNRKVMIDKSGITNNPEEYDDWKVMLKNHQNLNGVVISTPNHLHVEQAVPILEMGLPIAIEKPLATTKSDCERIIDAERANNGRTLVGFVLRSTPFYGKVFELIKSGAIGKVVSIQADELPGWGVSSIMNRSMWRRYQQYSGGAMLEKSCHDMDVLNWLLGSKPLSLNSYGGNLIFNANSLLPEKCDGCSLNKKCQYYKEPVFSKHEDEGEVTLHQFVRDTDFCIYNIDKDIVDTQNVSIQYQSGAIANFMLNFNSSGPKAGRNIHVIGQKGRIWGTMDENTVSCYDNFSNKVQEFDTSGDGSGHGGGDKIHALNLRKMMMDPTFKPDQNAAAGYLSAVMCFAADISMQESRRVNFDYSSSDYIELA